MRTRALLAAFLLLGSSAASAPRRGWLTVAGLGSGAAGLAALAAGVALTVRAGGADAALAAYYAPGAGPHAEEVPYVLQLSERAGSDHRFGTAFLVSGGALLAMGVTALFLDQGPSSGPSLTLIPATNGVSVAFHCSW